MKILITGTSSGIGKGCAEFFLKKGHEVYGFDKNAATITQPGYTHFCLDIRDKDSYPELPPVDILINNAGTQDGNDIDVNLKGTISITERRRSGLYQKCGNADCALPGHLQQPGFRRRHDRAEPSGDGGQKTLGSDHGSDSAEAVDDCG